MRSASAATRRAMKSAVAACLAALAMGGAQAEGLALRLGGPVVQKGLPSRSGMSAHSGRYFVVGDDSPYLFAVDRSFRITGRRRLGDDPADGGGRIAKARKPDYEAMARIADWQGAAWQLVVGSGSKQATREQGLLIAADGRSQPYARDLGILYRDFAARAGFPRGQLVNIEALAVAGPHAYFFNRGNAGRNLVFKLALADLMAYMQGSARSVEGIELIEARLPRLDGVEAGFSGADFWPEAASLVYTASVEDTRDAYNDGKVLGSFVGLIPLRALAAGKPLDLAGSARMLATGQGQPVRTKVESVALAHTAKRRATGALVSDNDEGASEFFPVELRIAP